MAMGWLSLSGAGAFGMVFATRKDDRKRGARILKHGLWIGGFGVLVLWVLFTVGCGGGTRWNVCRNWHGEVECGSYDGG